MNHKITFHLADPMTMNRRMVFDSLLAKAYGEEHHPEKMKANALTIDKADLINFSGMPLIKHPQGYWMASWMFYNEEKPVVEGTARWRKRWHNTHDRQAFFLGNKKVANNRGRHKSYDMPIRMLDIRKCWFYFQSEAPEEVQRLIEKHIPCLGKKRSQGNGWIDRFEIAAIDYNPFDKAIIRPVPVTEANIKANLKEGFTFNIKTKKMAWKSPYWLPENKSDCFLPTSFKL